MQRHTECRTDASTKAEQAICQCAPGKNLFDACLLALTITPPVMSPGSCSLQTPSVQALPETYTSEATQGPLLCDIAYPMDAPGYAHDPTANPADVSLAAALRHQGPNEAARPHC